MAEIQKPLVIVIGFHQAFERVAVKGDPLMDEIDARGFKLDEKGKRIIETVEVDWVTYAPSHSPMGTSTTERVRHLRPTQEIIDGENAEKTKFMLARWAAIEPAYDAWKAGREMPTNGTPLAQWPGVSSAMADELRKYGVRTVEDVSQLSETQIDRIKLPNMRDMRNLAKVFLENLKSAASAERETERDNEIAALKEKLEAAMQLLEERTSPPATLSEADELRAKLDAAGIKYHHKAGLETLRALVKEAA